MFRASGGAIVVAGPSAELPQLPNSCPSRLINLSNESAVSGVELAGMSERRTVLISYKTETRALADELYAEFERAGFSPWMDHIGWTPHQP